MSAPGRRRRPPRAGPGPGGLETRRGIDHRAQLEGEVEGRPRERPGGSGSDISSGRATDADPLGGVARRRSRSRSRRRASLRKRAYSRATVAADVSMPRAAEAGVRHPAHRRAADDGGDPDDRCGRRREGVLDAGHCQDGADRDDRVGRRQDDDVRVGEGLQDAGRRAWRRRCRSARTGSAGCRGVQAYPPLLEVDARALGPSSMTTWVSTRSSLIGSSRTPGASGRTAPR